MAISDKGLTHVALECCSLKRSLDFYARFGNFQVVHSRDGIAWISDHTRAFAIVLAEVDEVHPLGPFPHLGFACGDRTEFDRLLQLAREEGRLRSGPEETGGPAGTYAFIDDPDGNTFEISIAQSVEVAVLSANTVAGARRLHVVGVMGSGQDEHAKLAEPLGQAIARMGCHLLTGGGGGDHDRGFTWIRHDASTGGTIHRHSPRIFRWHGGAGISQFVCGNPHSYTSGRKWNRGVRPEKSQSSQRVDA